MFINFYHNVKINSTKPDKGKFKDKGWFMIFTYKTVSRTYEGADKSLAL
jgi:hypothetical protein